MKKSLLVCAFALLLGSETQASFQQFLLYSRSAVADVIYYGGLGMASGTILTALRKGAACAYNKVTPKVNWSKNAAKIITPLALAATVVKCRGNDILSTFTSGIKDNVKDTASKWLWQLGDSKTTDRNSLALLLGFLFWQSSHSDNPSTDDDGNFTADTI